MKLDHDYYHLKRLPKKLAKRWGKPDLCEQDLLQWGAEGKLQFSIYLYQANVYGDAKGIQLTLTPPATDPDEPTVPCDFIRITNSKELFKISKVTVENFFDNEQHKDAGRKTHEVFAEISPWCKDTSCKWFGSCHVDCEMLYNISDLRRGVYDSLKSEVPCEKSDLIITREDILSFEENESIKNEEDPLYLRETEIGYNSELAIVIKTWKAIFVDKLFIAEKTAKQAAFEYITSKYPDYTGDTKNGTGALGRAVLMLNTGLRKNAWSDFKKKHQK